MSHFCSLRLACSEKELNTVAVRIGGRLLPKQRVYVHECRETEKPFELAFVDEQDRALVGFIKDEASGEFFCVYYSCFGDEVKKLLSALAVLKSVAGIGSSAKIAVNLVEH